MREPCDAIVFTYLILTLSQPREGRTNRVPRTVRVVGPVAIVPAQENARENCTPCRRRNEACSRGSFQGAREIQEAAALGELFGLQIILLGPQEIARP
jgi:hypothetical protein